MESCAVAIMQNYLQLDLGLAFGRDLLGLDLGVLVRHRKVAFGAWHPSDAFGHDKEHTFIFLVLHCSHLRVGGVGERDTF